MLIEENPEPMAACLRKVCVRPGRMREIGEAVQKDICISFSYFILVLSGCYADSPFKNLTIIALIRETHSERNFS